VRLSTFTAPRCHGVTTPSSVTVNAAEYFWDAHRAALGSRRSDAEYVKQQDREFFIGFARSWRSRDSEAGLRAQLASDNHTPDRFRIATVRNLDAWYEAFDVTPGQRLYLEPRARVRVW
jgi:putative endopeptidase